MIVLMSCLQIVNHWACISPPLLNTFRKRERFGQNYIDWKSKNTSSLLGTCSKEKWSSNLQKSSYLSQSKVWDYFGNTFCLASYLMQAFVSPLYQEDNYTSQRSVEIWSNHWWLMETWLETVTLVQRTHGALHISVTGVIWELLERCVGTAKAKQPRLHHRLPHEREFTGKNSKDRGTFFNQCDAYLCDRALLHSFISVSYLFYLWSCWNAHSSWL